MATRVTGRLHREDLSDTYVLWREPGVYAFEFGVEGDGAADLSLEVRNGSSAGDSEAKGEWRCLEARRAVAGGSRVIGSAAIPALVEDSSAARPPGLVQLRLRIARSGRSRVVDYDFSLEGGAA